MDNLTKLFRIRKTCLEMLRDREYLVSDEEISQNKDTFREQFGENPRKEDLTIMMPKQSDLTEQVRSAGEEAAMQSSHHSFLADICLLPRGGQGWR
jgi:hypothetical protein